MTNEEMHKEIDRIAEVVWDKFDKLPEEDQAQIARMLERDLTRAGIL